MWGSGAVTKDVVTAGQFGIDQLVMYLCEVVDLNNQLLNDQLFGG